jgi:hypothetical protein
LTFQDAARNLNKKVRFKDPKIYLEGEYMLTGIVVRKNTCGVFMQAELLQSGNSLIYAGLNQIYAVEESIPEEESA